jgi:hypothetical protein
MLNESLLDLPDMLAVKLEQSPECTNSSWRKRLSHI